MQWDIKLSPSFFIQDTSSLMARVEAYERHRQAHLEHIRAQIQDTELEEVLIYAPNAENKKGSSGMAGVLAHIQLADLQYMFPARGRCRPQVWVAAKSCICEMPQQLFLTMGACSAGACQGQGTETIHGQSGEFSAN